MDQAGSAVAASVAPAPLLATQALTKRFGQLTACDGISLEIRAGEIHALLGENGAGKSTLVKMLYGALSPDDGRILWEGRPVAIASPAEARRLGIGMVFQHFSLFEALSVAENIALALPPRGRRELAATIRQVSREYGLPLDPDANVADLSVGERQRVEIVRCLLQQPRLIIMDEPTSVLTPQEADVLFLTLRRLSSEGVAILYITHRLSEVLALASRATILRRGKLVSTADPRAESAKSLARMMVGAEIAGIERPRRGPVDAKPRLVLQKLSLPADSPFATPLSDIHLTVHAGEVIGIAGVAGNGQGEFFQAVSGERILARDDMVQIDGRPMGRRGVNERRELGAAFVPEERIGHGAVPAFRLSENVVLTRHATDQQITRGYMIDRGAARAVEERIGERFDVRRSGQDPKASALSGGNLQKFIMGREIDRAPGILVVNQPTWGVDAGAARTIRQALVDLARAGSAVLMISQDLDEIFEIADRVAVLSNGKLSPLYPAETMTADQIGLLMGESITITTDAPEPTLNQKPTMRLELVRRPQASGRMAILSPLIAVALTIVATAIIFALYGVDPVRGLTIYFIEPLTEGWSREELVVKATPLILIAAGLAVAYVSNNWNIGAEGQFTIGAITGSMLPILVPDFQNFATLPLMLVMGALGGALYAMIPALLKVRFGTNEILTSLMLVYVSGLFLDWTVRGPWRDPMAFGFPNTVSFSDAALIPFIGNGRLNASAIIALAVVLILAVIMARTLKGFEIRVLGESPRAGRFAGFSAKRMTVFAFAVSGGLAGLAGIMEVASVIGKLQPVISPGYGFTAIIVAFLGRLNPIGILIAGFVIALSYLGGEAIQSGLQVSAKMAQVLQGMLLFFVLACDTLILYRIRVVRRPLAAGAPARA